MLRRFFLIAGIFFGLALGTQAHGQAPASPASSPSANGGPEARSGVGKDANYAYVAEHQRGGLHFDGNVKVEGAALPWDPIPVTVTCNGVVRYRTEADPKGQFTIQGSQATPLVPTKSNPHELAASQLVGCSVHASVPGFKSSTLHIANQDIMDNPNIGTVVLHPDNAAAGSSTSGTTAAAPKDAMKKFDKAREEWLSRNPKGAEHDLEKAVKTDPQFAEAWYQLGKLQQAKNDNKAALESYQKAVAADPKFVSPYERIAELSSVEKNWPAVGAAATEALKLDPVGTPQLWYFDALAKYNQGKADEAEASAQKSIAMDPQHLAPNTEQLLAVILAGKGDLADALRHLQNSLTYLKPGPNRDLVKQQIAQLEKVMPQDSAK